MPVSLLLDRSSLRKLELTHVPVAASASARRYYTRQGTGPDFFLIPPPAQKEKGSPPRLWAYTKVVLFLFFNAFLRVFLKSKLMVCFRLSENW